MFSNLKKIMRPMTLLACSFAIALCAVPSQSNAEPKYRIKVRNGIKTLNRIKIKDLVKKKPIYVFQKTNVQIEVPTSNGYYTFAATKTVTVGNLKFLRFCWSTKEKNIANGQWRLFSNKPISLVNVVQIGQVTAPKKPGTKTVFNLDLHAVIAAKNNGSVPIGTYYLAIYPQNAQNVIVGKMSNLVEITVIDDGGTPTLRTQP